MKPHSVLFGGMRALQPQPKAKITHDREPPQLDMRESDNSGHFKQQYEGFSADREKAAAAIRRTSTGTAGVWVEEEESILEPSVMVPYNTKVGEAPRKVQVERRKQLYALQNISELLAAQGLIPEDIQLGKDHLPVHLFDNTDFETRHPSHWVNKMIKVPAQAAFVNFEGACIWKDSEVLDYKEDNNTYLVQWNDTGQTSWLPRILVHFKAENPFLFTRRFLEAHKLRSDAELLMKYNLYVNSMSEEDTPPLQKEQEERLRRLVLNVKVFSEKDMDLHPLVAEVNSEYARVMNRIMLNKHLHKRHNLTNEFIMALKWDPPIDYPLPIPM